MRSQQALMKRIEREALKAARQAKKTYKLALQNQRRKEPTHCESCGVKSEHLRYYVDESNIAVTQSAKALCPGCYRRIYGGAI